MALTSIGSQKTPGRPVEITFAGDLGLPSDQQELILIGHMAASGDAASGTQSATGAYVVTTINNVSDLDAASGEANTKFGAGSELANMVIAAVRANSGGSTFPSIKCVPLLDTDTDFGPSDAALTAASKVKGEFLVSPYDGQDSTLRGKLKDTALLMSGAQRVHNNQFGTMGVVFNRSEADPSLLDKFDSQFVVGVWLPDSSVGDDAPAYSIGEMAAAAAGKMGSNISPFNPLDSVTIVGIDAPAKISDFPTVGAGLESESALNQGWTPLYVKPNGEVAFVRTVTGRISADGSGLPVVQSYYDVQDFQVLYFWRKTVFTRFSQPDFKQRKASNDTAREIKSELIRLATEFEDEQMFQAVSELAKQFQVERNASDRHRFDVKTPVNVIPGLHVIAVNVQATTLFDVVTI